MSEIIMFFKGSRHPFSSITRIFFKGSLNMINESSCFIHFFNVFICSLRISIYFYCILCLPLPPSRPSHPLYPANFIFFFSLNKQEWSLICATQLLLIVGTALKSGSYAQWYFIEELSEKLATLNSFLAMGRTFSSRCWNLSASSLCRSSACSHSLCEFVCAPALLCMENTFLESHPPRLVLTFFLSAPHLPTPPCRHLSLWAKMWWRHLL